MDPETGRIQIGWELFAGGMAGGSQVVRHLERGMYIEVAPIYPFRFRFSQIPWKLCMWNSVIQKKKKRKKQDSLSQQENSSSSSR